MMIKIAPSILSADFANLGREIERVKSADWLHVDVMDGMFVSNISIGVPVVKSLRRATDMFLDVHLMIEKPRALHCGLCGCGSRSLIDPIWKQTCHRSFDEALRLMDEKTVKNGHCASTYRRRLTARPSVHRRH